VKPLDPRHHEPRRYEVHHVTTYRYAEDVTASYGRACLRPRDTATQRVLEHEIRIEPEPDLLTGHEDLFGNHSHYVEIQAPHRLLEVAKTSVVAVDAPAPDLAALDRWTVGGAAAAATAADDPTLRTAYLLPSALVALAPEVRRRSQAVLPPDAPLGEALDALVSGIFAEFRYEKGATTVRTTLPELLRIGAGVCQDFAHLAIGCLRAAGLPARYVSGYLETQPPPGRPKLRGADATHAWASVGLPDGRWLDLDPTNDCLADGRYVTTAWGRDYRDVAPLKGVIYTEGATSSLTVSVDVHRLPD
jgi:transglutaminase-like putative cysteine protease